MMKQNILILAVAAAAFSSCSSDEVVSQNTTLTGNDIQLKEIGISPLSRSTTRAYGSAEYNVVEGVLYPSNYRMKVVAYSVPESGTPGNYFGSATADGGIPFIVQYAEGAPQHLVNPNYWGGNPAQYWPLSPATLNFLAVSKNGSPDADVVSPRFNANYASGVTVTLSDNKPTNAHSASTQGQHDLMYAFGRAQVTQSGNALSFPDKVDMTFNHALAWVVFRVKAGNSSSEAIKIKEIRLNGANYAGTFQAEVNNYDKAAGSGDLSWNTSNTKWTAASANADNIPSPNMTIDADGDGDSSNDSKSIDDDSWTQIGDGIMVVPTSELTSTPSIASFDIDYYLNKNLYTYNYTPAVLTYEKGKKYVYDITMTLHEIFVNPSVESWQDGGTEFVDIPTFAAGTNRTLNVRTEESTYTFYVTGFAANESVTIGRWDSHGMINTLATGDTTADANGILRITFTVNANATPSLNSATIQINSATDSHDTDITLNQPGVS